MKDLCESAARIFLTAGDDESRRKQIMLYILSVLGIVFLVIMSRRLFKENDPFYAFLNLGFGGFLLVLFFFVRSGKHLKLYSVISISLLLVFFMFLFHSGAGDGMAFIWYYLFPLVSLFLLGTRLGVFFSLFIITVSLIINGFADSIPVYVRLSGEKILRITYSYLAVFLFALAFERTRLAAWKKVNELALRDTLTGLYNRRYMDDVVLRMVRQCRRSGLTVAFFMADIDYFKKYNDTYGHQAGDAVLKTFADMLVSLIRRETDFVFRYGGEEFAGILSSTNEETARNLAERIVNETHRLSFPHAESPFGNVTVSVGMVWSGFPRDMKSEELIRLADEALYEAKAAGRNRSILRRFDG